MRKQEEINFLVYCLESYKNATKQTGAQVVKIFNDYDVFNYVRSSYDALHTTGREYIIDDIRSYIKQKSKMVH